MSFLMVYLPQKPPHLELAGVFNLPENSTHRSFQRYFPFAIIKAKEEIQQTNIANNSPD